MLPKVVATIIPALLVLFSGAMKLIGGEQVVQVFTGLGVIQFLPFLGAAEIVFALLFIPRKSMKIGFLLLSCYFAGAMATELSHGMMPIAPVVALTIIWIAALIRDRSIFFQTQNPAL